MLFEVSDTTFSTIVSDQGCDGFRIQLDVSVLQAGRLLCLRGQISLGNGNLFFGYVTANFENLHSVEKWSRNRVQHVSYKGEKSF